MSLNPDHIESTRKLTRELRKLLDHVSRLHPGPDSDAIAARVEALVEDVDAMAGAEQAPWFHSLTRESRQQLVSMTAGERTNTAGTSWTEFNPIAPPLVLEMTGQESRGVANLGAAFCGPPGRVHGGTVATMLDHAMGALLFHLGRPSFTARLEIDYRSSSPLNEDLEVSARVEKIDGRKTWVESSIVHNGVVAARAHALFVTVAGS